MRGFRYSAGASSPSIWEAERGLAWPGGVRGSGWLDADTPVRIGPFHLRLRAPVADLMSDFPAGYNPLAADAGVKTRPAVTLEFRNGKRGKDRWAVNRLLTLVGRSPDCKIHLSADDIASFHCGLVSTRTGLWVVDLSGRGVVVNGERMRVAPLPHGAELWVGRFLIGCQYQDAAQSPGARGGLLTPPPARSPAPAKPVKPAKPPVEDEVELGAALDPGGELPNSHIMADAFQPHSGTSANGGLSTPIRVAGSGPSPAGGAPAADLFDLLNTPPPASPEATFVALLGQLAVSHARVADEFQRSLALVAQIYARVRREHLPELHRELSRIQELTAELATLQADVSRQAADQAADRVKPGSSVVPRPASAGPRAIDRLNAVAQERAARWQTVIALFTGV